MVPQDKTKEVLGATTAKDQVVGSPSGGLLASLGGKIAAASSPSSSKGLAWTAADVRMPFVPPLYSCTLFAFTRSLRITSCPRCSPSTEREMDLPSQGRFCTGASVAGGHRELTVCVLQDFLRLVDQKGAISLYLDMLDRFFRVVHSLPC